MLPVSSPTALIGRPIKESTNSLPHAAVQLKAYHPWETIVNPIVSEPPGSLPYDSVDDQCNARFGYPLVEGTRMTSLATASPEPWHRPWAQGTDIGCYSSALDSAGLLRPSLIYL